MGGAWNGEAVAPLQQPGCQIAIVDGLTGTEFALGGLAKSARAVLREPESGYLCVDDVGELLHPESGSLRR